MWEEIMMIEWEADGRGRKQIFDIQIIFFFIE